MTHSPASLTGTVCQGLYVVYVHCLRPIRTRSCRHFCKSFVKHSPRYGGNTFYTVRVKQSLVVLCSVITMLYNLITKEGHQILMETLLIPAWVMGVLCRHQSGTCPRIEMACLCVCVCARAHHGSMCTFQHPHYS